MANQSGRRRALIWVVAIIRTVLGSLAVVLSAIGTGGATPGIRPDDHFGQKHSRRYNYRP